MVFLFPGDSFSQFRFAEEKEWDSEASCPKQVRWSSVWNVDWLFSGLKTSTFHIVVEMETSHREESSNSCRVQPQLPKLLRKISGSLNYTGSWSWSWSLYLAIYVNYLYSSYMTIVHIDWIAGLKDYSHDFEWITLPFGLPSFPFLWKFILGLRINFFLPHCFWC